MELAFRPSERATLGVELELGIVGRGDGDCACAASQLIADLAVTYGRDAPRVKSELYECTVEVVSGVCDTPAAVHSDLAVSIGEVWDLLAPRGLGLLGLAAHPFARWRDLRRTPGDRYDAIVERVQWPVRRLITQGMHVHVGVRSAQRAIEVTNALRGYLPVFLALSASSPYWQGFDTGLASCRSTVFGGLPSAGLPPAFADWADFCRVAGALNRAGTITTPREMWWDLRPHPDFGTVEVRVFDVPPTLREACALAALTQALVVHIDDRLTAGETIPPAPEWLVRENKWRATRYGVDAELIVDDTGRVAPLAEVVDALAAELHPVAVRLGGAEELADVTRIVAGGAGYARFRRAVTGVGVEGAVAAMVRELETDRPAWAA